MIDLQQPFDDVKEYELTAFNFTRSDWQDIRKPTIIKIKTKRTDELVISNYNPWVSLYITGAGSVILNNDAAASCANDVQVTLKDKATAVLYDTARGYSDSYFTHMVLHDSTTGISSGVVSAFDNSMVRCSHNNTITKLYDCAIGAFGHGSRVIQTGHSHGTYNFADTIRLFDHATATIGFTTAMVVAFDNSIATMKHAELTQAYDNTTLKLVHHDPGKIRHQKTCRLEYHIPPEKEHLRSREVKLITDDPGIIYYLDFAGAIIEGHILITYRPARVENKTIRHYINADSIYQQFSHKSFPLVYKEYVYLEDITRINIAEGWVEASRARPVELITGLRFYL